MLVLTETTPANVAAAVVVEVPEVVPQAANKVAKNTTPTIDMSSITRPTTIGDEARILEFLTRIFAVDHNAPFVDPDLLRWKYWQPRSDYDGPRSFVVEKNDRVVAHVGLWPVTVQTERESLHGVHMIDWASDPRTPGAGVALLQRLTKTHDFVYSIGGSGITQSILPKFGFRTAAQASTFARPIRPWRQIFKHQTRNARLPLRLARNFWWSRTPLRLPAHGWAAAEADIGGVAGIAAIGREREEGFFRYLQQIEAHV